MDTVRIGIIGVGNMGSVHAKKILEGKIEKCILTALCDIEPSRLTSFPENIAKFSDSRELIRSGKVDAVLIATPHYSHTTIGIDALENGLHVLVEKPLSLHKADCERMIQAHRNRPDLVFAAMFQERLNSLYIKVKEIVSTDALGNLIRINWIITNWLRTEYYYRLSDWRATWAGEGGGVLLNQCPHQLDLLQWICGMPVRVQAFCALGKRHDIEVEDDVTAYMEYSKGATCVFIASTGETPGTNRLEITGELGKLVVEDGKILWLRNKIPAIEFIKTADKAFDKPETEQVDVTIEKHSPAHVGIIRNFVDAVLNGAELVAPAEEGIYSVELANAMLYSSITNTMVKLPLDSKKFAGLLEELIKKSHKQKRSMHNIVVIDMQKSYTS